MKYIPGGFNCTLYKITGGDGRGYIAKVYTSPANRAQREFQSFSFLWNHGIRSIPEPIFAQNNIGVYSFIKGEKIPSGKYTTADISKVIQFWQQLHALKDLRGAQKLPVAKDACFSVNEFYKSIDSKLIAFCSIDILRVFFRDNFIPLYKTIKKLINVDSPRLLPRKFYTLSPSDFSFHNALRDKRGKLIFFDFEYFGWDDPAKMVADFFLHPKMNFPTRLRPYFFEKVRHVIAEDSEFPKRLVVVYLLQSLRWCLIMLNIFLREGKESKRALMQLTKAKYFLRKTHTELDTRPFPLSFL